MFGLNGTVICLSPTDAAADRGSICFALLESHSFVYINLGKRKRKFLLYEKEQNLKCLIEHHDHDNSRAIFIFLFPSCVR